ISLQALIPPCAQTECDRFTGTIENRSTVTPSSASLMVQASPASPPPTTITRFLEGKAIVLPCSGDPQLALPHLLAHHFPLAVDEPHVMVQVLDGVLQHVRERLPAALSMPAGAGEGLVRELAEQLRELLARR